MNKAKQLLFGLIHLLFRKQETAAPDVRQHTSFSDQVTPAILRPPEIQPLKSGRFRLQDVLAPYKGFTSS